MSVQFGMNREGVWESCSDLRNPPRSYWLHANLSPPYYIPRDVSTKPSTNQSSWSTTRYPREKSEFSTNYLDSEEKARDYVLLKQEFGILPAVYVECTHLSVSSQLDPVAIFCCCCAIILVLFRHCLSTFLPRCTGQCMSGCWIIHAIRLSVTWNTLARGHNWGSQNPRD